MFTHVVESNQHSLHDIYVHGGLYPTHACIRCKLILMHVYDCCHSPSWSLPSLLLAFTCTKREYCLCIQTPQTSKLFHTSPPYLPICGIYLPFQVNLYVPNSKPSSNHPVLYAWIAHVSTRVVCIFHVRRVILKRSGLRSSLMRKWLVTGMPSPML